MIENPAQSPWFWAFLAAIGWGMGIGLVGTKRLGRKLGFGIIMLILAEVPRVLLPMGFVTQPRIMPVPAWLVGIGWIILVGSFIFAIPVLHIIPLTAPDRSELLWTTGIYSIVRHPLMLCDIFWPLGWSLIFGSIIGILLILAWVPIIWILTNVEEEALVREYGDAYRDFQSRVPRLFPHLPHIGK